MIGHQLWDRLMFGLTMILIGLLFAWLLWDKSRVLVAVGAANILFGLYVIWGAFAWQTYQKKLWQTYGRRAKRASSGSL